MPSAITFMPVTYSQQRNKHINSVTTSNLFEFFHFSVILHHFGEAFSPFSLSSASSVPAHSTHITFLHTLNNFIITSHTHSKLYAHISFSHHPYFHRVLFSYISALHHGHIFRKYFISLYNNFLFLHVPI